jgi:hypothetical protein
MPHERGLTPVLPSEFFCPVLADRNLRFNRPLASRSTRANQSACLTVTQTIDLKILPNFLHPRNQSYSLPLCVRRPDTSVFFTIERAVHRTQICEKRLGRKDAQPSS